MRPSAGAFGNPYRGPTCATSSHHARHVTMCARVILSCGVFTAALVRLLHAGLKTFSELLLIRGVGARTVRALALVAEVVHGTPCASRTPLAFHWLMAARIDIPFLYRCGCMTRQYGYSNRLCERPTLGEKSNWTLSDHSINKQGALSIHVDRALTVLFPTSFNAHRVMAVDRYSETKANPAAQLWHKSKS